MKRVIFLTISILFSNILTSQTLHSAHSGCSCHSKFHGHAKTSFTHKSHPLSQQYDVKFYYLDVSVEATSTYIEGFTTIAAEAVGSMDTIAFELDNSLGIDSVYYGNQKITFSRSGNDVFALLPATILASTSFDFTVYYGGTPQPQGFFSGINSQYDNSWGFDATWTLSEPFHAKDWFACKQDLHDKADSAWIFITTSTANKAGSNGLLTAVTPLPNNKHRFEWKTRYPIAYYLISLSVADYQEYNIWAKPQNYPDSILIQNYIYDSPICFSQNKNDIDETSDLVEFFSDIFTMYPFAEEKYGHCLTPLGGGMEHQTMSTMGGFNFTLVAHELAHQWFGDNVTCATWQDIWINEGFASYSEYLALQHLVSQNDADTWLNNAFNYVMSQPDGSVYIPLNQTNDVWRIFDGRLSYKKGASLLHMIRFEVNNDTVFFNILKEFQTLYADSVATGLDFKQLCENISGLSFTDFFDQWYFGEGFPTYSVVWNYDNDTLILGSTQTTSSTTTPLFKMNVEYKLLSPQGDTTIRIYQSAQTQYHTVVPGRTITGIEVDPDNWILDGSASVIMHVNEDRLTENIIWGPNPVKNQIQINNPDDEAEFSIINMNGSLIRQGSVPKGGSEIFVEDLPSGLYFILFNVKENIQKYKFIKQ